MRKEVKSKITNYTKMPNKILRNEKISKNEKLVFLLIASYEPCFVRQKGMAKTLGMAPDTVRSAIKKLEKYHVVSIKRPGQGRSNTYDITPPERWNLPKKDSPEKVGGASTNGSLIQKSGVQESSKESDLDPQNMPPNKSNSKKSTSKQINSNKSKTNINSSVSDESPFPLQPTNPKEEIKSYYRYFTRRYFKMEPEKSDLNLLRNSNFIDSLTEIAVDYAKQGGTLYHLVKSEFERLRRYKTKHVPVPRFLVENKASKKNFQTFLTNESWKNDWWWKKLIRPFSGKYLITKIKREDPEFQLASKILIQYEKFGKSIKTYERSRWSNQSEVMAQMGPHVIYYLVLKQLIVTGTIGESLCELIHAYQDDIDKFLNIDFLLAYSESEFGLPDKIIPFIPREMWGKEQQERFKAKPGTSPTYEEFKSLNIQ